MNRLASALLVIALFFVPALSARPHDAEWKQVDDAVAKGLPKTAIERLDPIIAGALAEKSYPEAIRAIGRKVQLQGEIEGGKAEEKITRFQREVDAAPAAMKPMMEAILAHWYWEYFRQNRWRFLRRTQTSAAPGPDIQTWDLPRILTEIDRHFSAALADETALKATPISTYDNLLDPGNVPDAYRPTVFDFLVYNALEFYQSGEQGAVAAEDAFELDAGSPIFDDAASFLAWKTAAPDGYSPKLKTVRLYQELLRFHERDADRSAFYDADLARLVYGHNSATGDDKIERYEAALRQFIDHTSKHEVSARALGWLATQLNEDGNPAEAHQVAERGAKAFPKTAGAALCSNLLRQIEAPSARVETERVWNAPWPTVDVSYRNISRLYFRAIAVNFDDYVARSRWGLGNRAGRNAELDALRAATPTLSWRTELPPTADFKERTEHVAAPTSLKPGFYFIVATSDGTLDDNDNQVSVTPVWVSELALILRDKYNQGRHGGFVLNATSGEPILGATIRRWQQDREGYFKPLPALTTDSNGQFESDGAEGQIVLLAEHGTQAVSAAQPIYVNTQPRGGDEEEHSQTVFFTDRSIYRPGQTINYKGICIRYDHENRNYATLARTTVEISFRDPNHEEIAHVTQRTNDYGSFSGVFTAPRDRLTGSMSLTVASGPPGGTGFNVEEYKRPKFEVKIEAPAEAAKLGEQVSVTGKAISYTGASIGGAKVAWRVERHSVLPLWCWWWQPRPDRAIAHGTAVTELDGTFKLQFPATPDRDIPTKNEPMFVFAIHADVTDITGETRSDERSVKAGYTALQANLKAEDWQTSDRPVTFTITTRSLDGAPQPATGTLTVNALRQPSSVQRAALQPVRFWWSRTDAEPPVDAANPESWELAEQVSSQPFTTDTSGKIEVSAALKPGIYRASLQTKDRFGRDVTAREIVEVIDLHADHFPLKVPNRFAGSSWTIEPGGTFTGMWGTGYATGRAFIEIECDGRTLRSYWTAANRTQERIEVPVTEQMRGGVTVRVTSVRENRAYFTQRVVEVPWSNKELTIKWETFRSKLLPGARETWTALVSGPDAKRTAAEMVATLYDASLDQFLPHHWPKGFGVFRVESSYVNEQFQNTSEFARVLVSWPSPRHEPVDWHYRSFPASITYPYATDMVVLSPFEVGTQNRMATVLGPSGGRTTLAYGAVASKAGAARSLKAEGAIAMNAPALAVADVSDMAGAVSVVPQGSEPAPKLDTVVARRNLNETAFFFPHLIAGDDGVVKIQFTIPEALTRWRFLGFAHDRDLRSGLLSDTVVTSKDLMVEPNPPRFVREGDQLEFTVKVTNQTDQPQHGNVQLTFADAASLKSVDDALGNRQREQAFEVPAHQSRSYAWRITVPDGLGFLTYKAVAATAKASDGEEGNLPVLSRRVLVTESLPLPIRGPATKQFEFTKLLASGQSDTLRSVSLTAQMTSQPAWYAVMALPYLMEFPYECSEQVFNRLYANALARHIAQSDPKIRRVFDLWRNTPALDSPLEKNQELKSVALEETPWVRAATNENQARHNVGLLFDDNRLDSETTATLRKLTDQQLAEGLWPWFPGGRPSEYISLYIVTGFGRLRHLGVDIDVAPAVRALTALDAWMTRRYDEIQKEKAPDQYIPGYTEALYLYGRSLFLNDKPILAQHRTAVDFFLRQARKYWVQVGSRMSQAHLALALQRFGDQETPLAIVRSLKERSVHDDELGMFWRDEEYSWWWYRAPIETQAMMIEAFGEVAHDEQAVDDCKVWLLKQKQTQDWRTTKATADAIYALLLAPSSPSGSRSGAPLPLLSSDALVELKLDGTTVDSSHAEAGTGFYEQRFTGTEIKPAMGHITVTKKDNGVSWGSVHWQYLEDIAKITPHEATPLRLKKTLFVRETTAKGQVLEPVSGAVSVGDELVVRIELRTDRDMEFVHLKDQRGSGTEPVTVLSRYKYQDGLAYYESTRDTATHFFIDYLPKGTYVFEYATRVQLKGHYQTGIAEIQCMYAPEFNSHSESLPIEVQ